MNDLIKRDHVLEIIEELVSRGEFTPENVMMSVNALPEETNWISVKNRLPEVNENTKEAIREYGDMFAPEFNVIIAHAKKATTLYYDGEGNWFDLNGTCYEVTHWMQMPDVPKEVAE